MKPEILERQVARACYVTVERLRVRLGDGAEIWREVERHGDAVAVLPCDSRRRTGLVVRLFRAPVFDVAGESSLEEACAGMIEDEAPETATRREALEELGVRLGALEWVARVWSSPGVGAARQSLFLAPYGRADRIAAGGGSRANTRPSRWSSGRSWIWPPTPTPERSPTPSFSRWF